MGAPRFTREQVQERREIVSGLHLQGRSLRQIAGEVGVNHTQVFLDIKAIRADWRTNTRVNFEEKQNMELARIDQIELEAWKAWGRTIGKTKVMRQEVSAGEHGQPHKKLVPRSSTRPAIRASSRPSSSACASAAGSWA